MPRYQVIDMLTLLVDKSLVVADEGGDAPLPAAGDGAPVRSRKARRVGEAGDVRTRHRDHYTSMAALLDGPAGSDTDSARADRNRDRQSTRRIRLESRKR